MTRSSYLRSGRPRAEVSFASLPLVINLTPCLHACTSFCTLIGPNYLIKDSQNMLYDLLILQPSGHLNALDLIGLIKK